MSDTLLSTRICRHFRTKAMFTREEGVDRVKVTEETIHFPYCWCAKSATELGPDDLLVDPQACSREGRHCRER